MDRYATRVSPTGATRRTFALSAPGATEAVIRFPRQLRPADSDRSRSAGERAESLCGDRWPQAHGRLAATAARHRRSGCLADDGSRGSGAEPLLALVEAGERFGGRLVVGRAPATLRSQPGAVGAPVRSQCELGFPSPRLGGGAAAKCAATSTQRPDLGAGGDEVFVAGGAFQSAGLPANGRRLRPRQVHHATSRAVIHRLAPGVAPDPATHSPTATAVLESPRRDQGPTCGQFHPASARGSRKDRNAGSPRQPTTQGSDRGTGTDGSSTERTDASPAPPRPRRTQLSGDANPPRGNIRKGTSC